MARIWGLKYRKNSRVIETDRKSRFPKIVPTGTIAALMASASKAFDGDEFE
jgi:hypothetical protein